MTIQDHSLAQVLSLIDEAAGAVGMPQLEQNEHFVKDVSHGTYRRYHLQSSSSNYVDLGIELYPEAIVFSIDRVMEALTWGLKHFAEHVRTVEEMSAFFSGYLMVEHQSRRKTRLTLFQADGEQRWSFKHTQWPGVEACYERRLFLPLNTLSQAV